MALAPLDVDVHKGSIVGLLGPNGAGKTTLLRMVTGITKPDAGTLLWADLMVSPARPLGSQPASPLVPLWHEFLLEPARAEPALGLSRGSASVHLLPSRGGGPGGAGKFFPSEGCLQRSEFLEPLSEVALEQLRDVVLAL